jgi:hypothetical protein
MRLAEHKCEGVTGWDSVYADQDGDWIFNASAGDSETVIKFCPFCGYRLEHVDAVPREQPILRKSIISRDFADFQIHYNQEVMKNAFMQESEVNRLFKKEE